MVQKVNYIQYTTSFQIQIIPRSSRPVFYKKSALKNFANFTYIEEHQQTAASVPLRDQVLSRRCLAFTVKVFANIFIFALVESTDFTRAIETIVKLCDKPLFY